MDRLLWRASYVYVGDYAGGQVVRFDANTGATVAPTPYISISGAEGVGGTNAVLVVASANQFINLYNTATQASTPPLLQSISTPGFQGLRVAVSLDGNDFYVAGGNQVREYDFATGTLQHTITNPDGLGVWGVAVNPLNGNVYWTTGWNSGGVHGSVYSTNASLTSGPTQVEAAGANGATSLVGITFRPDGSFYVVNGGNGDPNNPLILHYNANGTFRDLVSMTGMPSGALYNAFDTEVGPNGNLFVTSQGGACVVEFNANDTYNSIFIPAHAGNLNQAKTIHFSVNNFSSVPEPASIVMAGTATLVLLGYGLRRRSRRALA